MKRRTTHTTLLLIGLASAACGEEGPDDGDALEPSLRGPDVVGRVLNAIGAQDRSSVAALLADSAVWEIRGTFSGETVDDALIRYEGREAVLGFFDQTLMSFERTVFEVLDLVEVESDGSQGVVMAELRGDFVVRGEDTPYRNLYLMKITHDNERVTRVEEYYNPIHVSQVVGVDICGDEGPMRFDVGGQAPTGSELADQGSAARVVLGIQNRDRELVEANLAEDAIWEIRASATGGTAPDDLVRHEGREAILGFFDQVLGNFEQTSFSRLRLYAALDASVVHVEAKGDFLTQGGRAPYQNLYMFKMTQAEGRVTRIDEYYNPIHLARALGTAPCS